MICSVGSDSYGSDQDDVLYDGNTYISTVNYTRQAQDELSVNTGQLVTVVDDSDKSESDHNIIIMSAIANDIILSFFNDSCLHV